MKETCDPFKGPARNPPLVLLPGRNLQQGAAEVQTQEDLLGQLSPSPFLLDKKAEIVPTQL